MTVYTKLFSNMNSFKWIFVCEIAVSSYSEKAGGECIDLMWLHKAESNF